MRRSRHTHARSVMTEEYFSDLALISMKEYLLMKFARHSCMPIPENCFKHPYLTIVVHRSSNSCNRNLINATQFYVVFCA